MKTFSPKLVDATVNTTNTAIALRRWYVISSVYLLVYPSVCLSIQYILKRLRYHLEIFTGVRHCWKLGRVRRWLHSDALRCRGDDL